MSALALLVCSWIALDGSVSFTDDPRRVPSAYSETAECHPLTGGLEAYERYTRDDSPYVPNQALEDAPGSTIVDEEVVEVQPKTKQERRRKRHRSNRS